MITVQELGALGEFLGFFAVLATLIYLAVQTRHARQVAQIEACRTIVADFLAVWTQLAQSDDFAMLMRRAVNDWDSLSKTEQTRAHAFFSSFLVHFAGTLAHESLPEVREWAISLENNLVSLVRSKGGRKWYVASKPLLEQTAVKRIDERLADPQSCPDSWENLIPWWLLDEG